MGIKTVAYTALQTVPIRQVFMASEGDTLKFCSDVHFEGPEQGDRGTYLQHIFNPAVRPEKNIHSWLTVGP